MRAYAPVVVRGEEDKGTQLWSFGKRVYQDLLSIMLDPDYGDITDPLEGRDVKVTITKQPGQNWATTTVMPRGKQTHLSDDDTQSQNLLDNLPNLDELYSLESYEEIEKKVNDWLNGSSSSDGTEQTTTTTTTNTTTTDTTTTSQKSTQEEGKQYTSLDEAFADLLEG